MRHATLTGMNLQSERSPFLQSIRHAIQQRHYSIRTEQAYLHWISRFILFHNKHHPKDLKDGLAGVYLPNALDRKYPNAGREWGWQYVFHAPWVSTDPRTGID